VTARNDVSLMRIVLIEDEPAMPWFASWA